MKTRLQVAAIGAVWGILSALCFLRWQAPIKGWILGGLGATLVVSGLLIPPLAALIKRALDTLTQAILAVVTWILLGLTYFLFITPLGLVLRMTGSVQTTRGATVSRDSYWSDRPRTALDVARYLRPF